MKKYNLSKPEKYVGKDGQEKTMWHNVGTLTEFTKQDGTVSRIVEVPAIGLKASVFEQTPRVPATQPHVPVPKPVEDIYPTEVKYPEDEVNPDDIPF